MSSCASPSGSPRGDAQLQFDEIEPGDRLGDRMLDLQPRVHFHEIEVAAGIEQEFQRAGALVAQRLDGGDRDRAHPRPQFAATPPATAPPRSASDAAAAPSNRARRDGWHCHRRSPNTWISIWRGSTMARSRITVAVAERALRFRSRAAQRIGERSRIRDQPHAAPAAAGDRLDHHGKADLLGFRQHHGVALVGALIAGHAGHAGRLHDLLGAGLVAHRLDGFRRRPDEHQPGIAAGARKILVLGQKAVAGMHRVGAAGFAAAMIASMLR